jgi:hypothetical protein
MGSHFALHCCSVVFMIMRFPLRVVAIGGVEAGSGKEGWHALVFVLLTGIHFRHIVLACSAVISVWRPTLKKSESASWQA